MPPENPRRCFNLFATRRLWRLGLPGRPFSVLTCTDQWTLDKKPGLSLSCRDMSQTPAPRLNKLPFLLGDLLLLASAAWVALYGSSLGPWQYAAVVVAVALGAWLAVWPFVLEFRAATTLAESSALSSVTDKINGLDEVATSITNATAEWMRLHQSGHQTVTVAEQLAERMTTEARNFAETLVRMNETEKNHLRLEVEKLHRAEGDWLGVTVRMLDHVHALYQAGVRSGQRNVIDQLTHFQNACRDTARRIGLTPLLPEVGTAFDPKAHHLLDGAQPAEAAVIGEILAPGYTFQGQMIRLPGVALKQNKAEVEEKPDPQLSFDEAAS